MQRNKITKLTQYRRFLILATDNKWYTKYQTRCTNKSIFRAKFTETKKMINISS